MPTQVEFTFFGDLLTLLRRPHQDGSLVYPLQDTPAVKDAIEACGIPHTEVDLLVCDQVSIDWTYRLGGGEQVLVYPPGYPVAIAQAQHLAACPSSARFILDVHLGKLASKLRLLGFDCLYRNDYDDREIVDIALQDERIILTADRGILKHRDVFRGLLIRSRMVDRQVDEVLKRFHLYAQVKPFSRCVACNGLLAEVSKDEIVDRLLPGTARTYLHFHQCQECGKLYWRGAHFNHLSPWLQQIGAEIEK